MAINRRSGYNPATEDRLCGVFPSTFDPGRTQAILDRIIAADDKPVMEIMALVMAETLALGTGIVDSLGEMMKVDVLTPPAAK